MGEDTGASIIVHIETAKPLSLEHFLGEFAGVGAQFEKHSAGLAKELAAEFYVQAVLRGSIIVELVPMLADPAFRMSIRDALDDFGRAELLIGFLEEIKRRLTLYFKGKRDAGASKSDLSDFHKTLAGIAAAPGGRMELAVAEFCDGERKVRSTFVFSSAKARRGLAAVEEHQLALAAEKGEVRQRVLLRFVRPSLEAVKAHTRSGERAIVEAISPKSLGVVYASEMARERIRSEMHDNDGNVFHLLFDVDVSVETSNGRPVAYRIMHVHDVVEGS